MKYLLLALLLAGCNTLGLTPAELRQTEPFRHALKGSTNEAARCIQKNVEDYGGQWNAEIRDNDVFIRYVGQVMAIAELEPTGSKTSARLYLARTYPRGEVAARYVNGC